MPPSFRDQIDQAKAALRSQLAPMPWSFEMRQQLIERYLTEPPTAAREALRELIEEATPPPPRPLRPVTLAMLRAARFPPKGPPS